MPSGLQSAITGSTTPTSNFTRILCAAPERNYTGYCNPEVVKLVDQQSAQTDNNKHKQLVWEIERRLAEDAARPIIFYPRSGACWQPQFKGHTMMINGNYNGWLFDDAWLDQ
jgi:peptide/nickel transport system substrate-binding protein